VLRAAAKSAILRMEDDCYSESDRETLIDVILTTPNKEVSKCAKFDKLEDI